MAHQYAVGVKDQAPLLFVVAATASPAIAQVRYVELTGRSTAVGTHTSDWPAFTRVTAAGTSPTTVTPQKLNPMSPASQFRGEHSYSGAPTVGGSEAGFPADVRDGYGKKTIYPPGAGPVALDGCSLAVVCDTVGANYVWDVNIVYEEL